MVYWSLKNIILVFVTFAVITFLVINFVIFPMIQRENEKRFIGTWQDIDSDVTFTFFSNKTFLSNESGNIYFGSWEITVFPWYNIRLDWGFGVETSAALFTENGTKLDFGGYHLTKQ